MATHPKQVLENIFALLAIRQNNEPNQTTVAGRELVKMLRKCSNPDCENIYETSKINDIDPSPDIDFCCGDCCRQVDKKIKLAKDKRKSLHVKPDTYNLYLEAKKKLRNDINFDYTDEKDSDDKILFSILTSFMRVV